MSSKDPEIQELYDHIRNYKPIIVKQCECDTCSDHGINHTIDNIRKEESVPTTRELDIFLKTILSIKSEFKSNPYKYDTPISKFRIHEDNFWGDLDYHIVFINDGIRISMTKDMVSKLAILNSILLEENGCDKPLRLRHLVSSLCKIVKGPRLYITRIPLESLIFNKPTENYNVKKRVDNKKLTTYFRYSNVAEAIYNDIWYS